MTASQTESPIFAACFLPLSLCSFITSKWKKLETSSCRQLLANFKMFPTILSFWIFLRGGGENIEQNIVHVLSINSFWLIFATWFLPSSLQTFITSKWIKLETPGCSRIVANFKTFLTVLNFLDLSIYKVEKMPNEASCVFYVPSGTFQGCLKIS